MVMNIVWTREEEAKGYKSSRKAARRGGGGVSRTDPERARRNVFGNN